MRMVGLVENTDATPVALGFSVSDQKVQLTLDPVSRRVRGHTVITIVPDTVDLKTIRLDCRQCKLENPKINDRLVNSWSYNDPYKRTKLCWRAGVHQYHMLEEKLEDQFKAVPDKELVINLPKSFKIQELDPFSVEPQTTLLTKYSDGIRKENGDITAIDLIQNTRIVVEQVARFTPIKFTVDFTVDEIRDGLQFVGWEDGDMQYPHVYTRNSIRGASCLFPCLDAIDSRCTWDISIKIPRTIGDALKALPLSIPPNKINGNHFPTAQDGLPHFSSEDQSLDLVVVCSGEMTDEIVDPLNPSMKTASFQCSTPVAPQHIGFAVGPFEYTNLVDFRELDEDEKLGQNAVPVHGFCLPRRVRELKNTCLPIAKAIDFFTLTYGSYPFSNYKICFVDDMVPDCVDTAAFSLCSSRMLFPEDIIESLDKVTRQLVHALASQWVGVNIIPKEPTDTWAVIGIAYFITDIFMKKLAGSNEYRYQQKRAADRIVESDIARPSIYSTGPLIHLDPSQLEFIALKAPVVLFILDRRLAKASGSSGLSRIISRVFLNAKVGDLANGAITTAYFMKTCEKLGHAKLETFFNQWVFGAGCPRFRVTQKFNKKKLMVEMSIMQYQNETSSEQELKKEEFMRDVKEEKHDVYAGNMQPVFTGPMTIRIHEADGTPYEHIVEIKEAFTKFEIQYNTKYKRLKRSRRQKERTAAGVALDFSADNQDDVLLYCLGDVLQSEEEIRDWKLVEWTKEDEDRMSQESYEWIRMDADFEWICRMSITMPGYMYLSQLQQDRDVVAQLESVQYMALQREHPLVSTILIRTLMDRRYFHGVRTAAAASLTKQAKDEIGWLGLYHLERAFREFFCFSDSPMTRSNDFSDRASYYIQTAIPKAIAKVRDNAGRAPFRVRKFLFETLRYNDNSGNEFSDCYYIATLMSCLAEAVASNSTSTDEGYGNNEDEGDDLPFHKACLEEVDRYRRLDQWIPSYHNILSITALECQSRFVNAGVTPIKLADLLQYTRDQCFDDLRIGAFGSLMELGMIRNDDVLRWFLFILGTDSSPYIREHMLRIFGRTLGSLAIGEGSLTATASVPHQDSLIIEQESSTEARQADLARRQDVHGAMAALKEELQGNVVLKQALWEAVESSTLNLREISELLEICQILYTPETSMLVVLKYPRYMHITRQVKGVNEKGDPSRMLILARSGPRLHLRLPRWIPKKHSQPSLPSPALKRKDSLAHAQPMRKLLKPPKKPQLQISAPAPPPTPPPAPAPFLPPSRLANANRNGGTQAAGIAMSPTPQTPREDGRPRLTLKLNLKGAGAKFKKEGSGTPK